MVVVAIDAARAIAAAAQPLRTLPISAAIAARSAVSRSASASTILQSEPGCHMLYRCALCVLCPKAAQSPSQRDVRTHAACGTEPRPRLDAATLRTGTGEDTGAQTRTWMQRLLTGHCQDSRKQEARGARHVAAHRHAAAHRSPTPPRFSSLSSCQAPPARRHAAALPGYSCAAAL